MTDLRLAISGAGRVWERLYRPALTRLAGVDVVAVADPDRSRAGGAMAGATPFPALHELLDSVEVDGVLVLSPPAQHIEDALASVARGLPVLVEKPLCASVAEVEQLRSAGAPGLLTPAFSRRYWPAYRTIAARGPVRDLRLAIAVDPSGWQAHTGPADVASDLFPHVADLARWLARSEIATVTGRRRLRGVEVVLDMRNGARVATRLDTRPAYREAARADGKNVHVGPPSAAASLLRRIGRRDDPAVEAVREMVRSWVESVRGTESESLPTFEDGSASVAAMEKLRAALGPASSPV
jgi:predicted dehydrogenase